MSLKTSATICKGEAPMDMKEDGRKEVWIEAKVRKIERSQKVQRRAMATGKQGRGIRPSQMRFSVLSFKFYVHFSCFWIFIVVHLCFFIECHTFFFWVRTVSKHYISWSLSSFVHSFLLSSSPTSHQHLACFFNDRYNALSLKNNNLYFTLQFWFFKIC